MTAIELEAIIYPSIVTLLAAFQLTHFARRVGFARKKCNVPYPQMTGDATFERTLRAQQNTLEFFPVFMACLWMSGLFFNQGASAVTGMVYIYSRQMYFSGYSQSVEDRIPGFKLGVKCLMLMLGMSVCGFIMTLLHMYYGIDLDLVVRSWFKLI
ncbi:microsomal glutathione S-transferase 2-like [Babylonia areolata]|uniref:microsomal glutathione S-transferase 2-like n=1 Tax=Babylonia areolata TaxID=304850 RepID=UPI003FD0EE36